MNRHKLDGTETTIDSSDELIDHSAKILVFFDILTTGYCYLHEDNFSDPFWMFRQEYFECMELLRNSFDVIQSVNSDNQLDTFEFALQDGDAVLYRWFL